jgi:hypothetical protein
MAMTTGSTVRGTLAAMAAATTLLFASGAALADEREQCASAADQAQQLRDDGKYRRAREQFLVCARDVCPGPIKKDCLDWLSQLEHVAPTVVFAAKEGTHDLIDVKVSMDGTQLTDHLDGRPVPVDLGEHTFTFEHEGKVQQQQVVIGAGQKGRNISAVFPAPQTTPVAPPPGAEGGGRGSIVPALVVGGIGVIGLGSFAFFGISGKSAVDDLQDCKPNCAESDVDKARTKLIVADISLGVGVVALGVATYMFLTRPKVAVDVNKTGAAPPERTVRFDVAPAVGGGGAASLSGTF